MQHQIRRMNLGGRAAPLPHSRRLIVQQIVSNSDFDFFEFLPIFCKYGQLRIFFAFTEKTKEKNNETPQTQAQKQQ